MIKLNKLIMLATVACIMMSVTACAKEAAPKLDEGVKAIVNGKTITTEQYEESLASYKKMAEAQYGAGSWEREIEPGVTLGQFYENGAALDNMIKEILLLEVAEKEGFEITEEELNGELETYKGYFSTPEEYEQFLKTNNMTEDFMKETLKKDRTINNYLIEKIDNVEPTDEELKTLYEKDKEAYTKVAASHILVATEDEAKAVLDRIAANEKFEDIATDVSICPSSAQGGDLGEFGKGEMLKEFEDAAFGLKIDEISQPVKTSAGYHVIRLNDKKENFEDSKDIVTENYKANKYTDLLKSLEENAKIEKK